MNDDLDQSRRKLELSLDELRESIHDEVGWMPKARRWALPIAAAAAGIVLGLAVRRALPRRRLRRI